MYINIYYIQCTLTALIAVRTSNKHQALARQAGEVQELHTKSKDLDICRDRPAV